MPPITRRRARDSNTTVAPTANRHCAAGQSSPFPSSDHLSVPSHPVPIDCQPPPAGESPLASPSSHERGVETAGAVCGCGVVVNTGVGQVRSALADLTNSPAAHLQGRRDDERQSVGHRLGKSGAHALATQAASTRPAVPATVIAVAATYATSAAALHSSSSSPSAPSPFTSSSSSPSVSPGRAQMVAASQPSPPGVGLLSIPPALIGRSVLPFLSFAETMDMRQLHRSLNEVCEQRAIEWMTSHFPLALQNMARDHEDGRGTMVRAEHKGVKKADRAAVPSPSTPPSSRAFLLSDAVWLRQKLAYCPLREGSPALPDERCIGENAARRHFQLHPKQYRQVVEALEEARRRTIHHLSILDIAGHILERHGHAHTHLQYMRFVRQRGLKSKATRQAREAERRALLQRGFEAAGGGGGTWSDALMTERARDWLRSGDASDQREVQRLVREITSMGRALRAARGDTFGVVSAGMRWNGGSRCRSEDEDDGDVDDDDYEMNRRRWSAR